MKIDKLFLFNDEYKSDSISCPKEIDRKRKAKKEKNDFTMNRLSLRKIQKNPAH